MPKNSDEVRVYLKITGFACHPNDISDLLGIRNATIWLKGEKVNPRSTVVHNQNGWMLPSNLSKDTLVSDQIKHLIDIASPKKELVRKLPSNSSIEIYCVVYSSYGRPDIQLSPDLIKEIAQIGASLAFDLYQLPNDE